MFSLKHHESQELTEFCYETVARR